MTANTSRLVRTTPTPETASFWPSVCSTKRSRTISGFNTTAALVNIALTRKTGDPAYNFGGRQLQELTPTAAQRRQRIRLLQLAVWSDEQIMCPSHQNYPATLRSGEHLREASMTYRPAPVDNSHIQLGEELSQLIEQLAYNNHELWAKGRIEEGWRLGPQRNDEKKETPVLVPYEQLPENEKEYDRKMAVEVLKTILALGYRIHPPEKE